MTKKWFRTKDYLEKTDVEMLHLPPNLQVTGSWSRKCTVCLKEMRMCGPHCQGWAHTSYWALVVRAMLNMLSKLIIRGQSHWAPVICSSSDVPGRSPEAYTSIHFPVAKYLTLGWMGKHPQIQNAYVVPEILGKLKKGKWIRRSNAAMLALFWMRNSEETSNPSWCAMG